MFQLTPVTPRLLLPRAPIVPDTCVPCVPCLLYTSDAADERSSVDLGGRRIIKKKKKAQRTQRRDDEAGKIEQQCRTIGH